ncbi:MAG: amidohydrolase family protein [bacterium]|nr:amidohydrolase family protein [bacterium]
MEEAAAVTAFVGVRVLPMDRERLLDEHTVVVRDGKIAEMGPVAEIPVPADARRIEGRGGILMPGLADMHVHLFHEAGMILYIANGVTTVRNMWGTPEVLAWREAIGGGELLGPTIYTSGPLLDGSPPIWDGSIVVEDADDASRIVAEHQEAGYDFLKIYSRLSEEAYRALVAAGRKEGLPAVGHVPVAVGLRGALDAGQASVEHLDGYLRAILTDAFQATLDGPEEMAETARRIEEGKVAIDEVIDQEKLARIVAATREAEVWNVPTLVVHEKTHLTFEERQGLYTDERMRVMDPMMVALWDPKTDFRYRDISNEALKRMQFWNSPRKIITRRLHEAGAGILLGTDTPNPYVIPGFSLHEELRLLVDAGLSIYDAIAAGTRNAAEFLGRSAEFGTVAVGRRADLILLEGNPLEDVAFLERRLGVMVRGEWFPEELLQQKLAELVASFTPPQDRFADLPPLPREGKRDFCGRYAIRTNGVTVGEERFAIDRLAGARRVVVAQQVYDSPANATHTMRLVVDASGIPHSLAAERRTPASRSAVEISRSGKTLEIHSRDPSGKIDRRIEEARDVLLEGPMIGGTLALAERLGSLAVGESAQLRSMNVMTSPSIEVAEATLTVTRELDGERTGADGSVAVRVYTVALVAANASFDATLTVDAEGYPVGMIVREQLAVTEYRKIESGLPCEEIMRKER